MRLMTKPFTLESLAETVSSVLLMKRADPV